MFFLLHQLMRDLTFGEIRIRMVASAPVLAAIEARFGAFSGPCHGQPAVTLVVTAADRFDPALERESPTDLTPVSDGGIVLSGAVTGELDIVSGRGEIRDARGFGSVDALVRAALSMAAPLHGGLLVHGALVLGPGGGLVCCGASGAGKSTLAQAAGAACDELTLLIPDKRGVLAIATPYWHGRPHAVRCGAVVCLERAGQRPPEVATLRGARAARALAKNVVRYAVLPTVESLVLSRLADVCARVPVIRACCPTGDDFLPFVSAQLGLELAA